MNDTTQKRRGKVYFIGAGPGAVDLVTVRGRRIIDAAGCIIYAGSLVNKDLFAGCSAPLYDSSGLTLDEVISIMAVAAGKGDVVARVHTGDPALYGAIGEQMARLDELSIEHEIVPGVSSAFAAAAALGVELTLPEVTQSVIITRRGGRTPVPEAEQLAGLAAHGATMMIFLSVGMIESVVSELLEGGYDPNTPVAVVMRASWPDQLSVRATLGTIADHVRAAGITRTALICVGRVFGEKAAGASSRLYAPDFSHGFRSGEH